MGGEVEAIGALATGGLVAHVMTRDGRNVHDDGELHACQNCGTTLAGPFCHACGQSGHVHRTLGHVIEEFAHGVFHVESKGWRTLPMLIVNPGRLTREYIHGKRARHIAPLALFLFMIFLTFFTFGMTGAQVASPTIPTTANDRAEAARDLHEAEQELASESKDPDTTAIERAALRQAVTVAQAKLAGLPAQSVSSVQTTGGKRKMIAIGPGTGWMQAVKEANARGQVKVNTGYAPFDARVHHALEDPEFAAYKVQEKAAKLSFILVPLSLPVLWLMFARRREVTLYDHVVFTLYSLSFMSLLVITIMVFGAVGASAIVPFLVLLPPVHIFAQLKGAYRLTTRGALWRASVLSMTSLMVLGLFFALMLLIGLLD